MPASRSRKAKNARAAERLEQIPNIGPSIAQDLRNIGIKTPRDLIGRDPQQLYERLCRRTRTRQDPCLLDTFTSAVRFMEGPSPVEQCLPPDGRPAPRCWDGERAFVSPSPLV